MQLTGDQATIIARAKTVLDEPARITDPAIIGYTERSGALAWQLANVIGLIEQLTGA